MRFRPFLNPPDAFFRVLMFLVLKEVAESAFLYCKRNCFLAIRIEFNILILRAVGVYS